MLKPYKCSKCGGSDFYLHGSNLGRKARRCKPCLRRRANKSYKPESARAGYLRRRQDPEFIRKQAENFRRWRKDNPERSRAHNRRQNENLRAEVLRAYGGKCSCCAESRPQFLAIDHVNNDGHVHRKDVKASALYRWLRKNSYPKDRFQLLCHNCNMAKAFYGFCHGGVPSL